MAGIRRTAEEKGTLVFDFLTATDRAGINAITAGTGLTRAAFYQGVRWLRDTLGHEALVCNPDGTYELAMTTSAVVGYRQRRQARMANELERLNKVVLAGLAKFGPDSDEAVAAELIRTAVTLLRRNGGNGQTRLFERTR